jgi:hypothetical protein
MLSSMVIHMHLNKRLINYLNLPRASKSKDARGKADLIPILAPSMPLRQRNRPQILKNFRRNWLKSPASKQKSLIWTCSTLNSKYLRDTMNLWWILSPILLKTRLWSTNHSNTQRDNLVPKWNPQLSSTRTSSTVLMAWWIWSLTERNSLMTKAVFITHRFFSSKLNLAQSRRRRTSMIWKILFYLQLRNSNLKLKRK